MPRCAGRVHDAACTPPLAARPSLPPRCSCAVLQVGLAVQNILDEVASWIERATVSDLLQRGAMLASGCDAFAPAASDRSTRRLPLCLTACFCGPLEPHTVCVLQALLSWQDPSATLGACLVLSAVAGLIFLLGLPAVLSFVLCFMIRPPALRTPTPPVPLVVLRKLPTRADRIV